MGPPPQRVEIVVPVRTMLTVLAFAGLAELAILAGLFAARIKIALREAGAPPPIVPPNDLPRLNERTPGVA